MDFQTPPKVCDYMVNMIPFTSNCSILEPTPGQGNIVKSLEKYNFDNIIAPDNFWDLSKDNRYDCIIMNPPFTPMKTGYEILYRCMDMSDNIIALMPWLTIINGEKRTKDIMNFGLKSVTHLPRKVFNGSRVQCCILEMRKGVGWNYQTIFKTFEL